MPFPPVLFSPQSVENCVCIMRNLSYHVHKEVPGADRYQEAEPGPLGSTAGSQHRRRDDAGCFGGKKAKGVWVGLGYHFQTSPPCPTVGKWGSREPRRVHHPRVPIRQAQPGEGRREPVWWFQPVPGPSPLAPGSVLWARDWNGPKLMPTPGVGRAHETLWSSGEDLRLHPTPPEYHSPPPGQVPTLACSHQVDSTTFTCPTYVGLF